MEELFEIYKDLKVTYPRYSGYVCGYNPYHFILAVESKDDYFFDSITKTIHIDDKYKDPKYKYICVDESDILIQNNNAFHYKRTV